MTSIDYKRLYELSIIEKESLLKEIAENKLKIQELTIHLKKYTNSDSYKIYYQKNKDKIIEQIKQYKINNKTDPEKIKEYNKRAYQKRKFKINNAIPENNITNI